MRALAFVAWTALAIAGCAADANSNPNQKACTDATQATDCRADEHCYRGFCVRDDAGAGPGHDGGPDTGMDSGPAAPDTGSDGGPDMGLDASRDAAADANLDADNHCDGGGAACTTGQQGLCNTGHISCGAMRCVRNADPIAEICNNHDDDCDGITDEETDGLCYPPSTSGCARNADGTFTCVGTCRPGTQMCNAGLPGTCTMDVVPQGEGCQSPTQIGLDDDCDGMVDNNPACTCTPAAMRQCFTGLAAQAGVGRCLTGTQTCDTTGHWGACTGSGTPMPETCANPHVDDDCDGTTDNVPGIGAPCTIAGAMGVCADGVTACMSNAVMCSAPASSAELCNHLDDDCDGNTDEGIDTQSDGNNCGACGHACGAGTSCCNGSCVDETSDAMACGMCTMTCGGGQSCCSSACSNPMTDRLNCGACGHTCAGGQSCCGGTCVDTTTDPNNCTGCGIPCHGTGMSCCGTCTTSTAPACTGCPFDCTTLGAGGRCCGTQCVDTSNDENHCGGCGMPACTAGQVCCGGTCVADDAAHCGGACTTCGTGQLCCGDRCVAGGDSLNCHMCGHACTTGQTCCGDGCHNFQTDGANCGSCGHACTTGTQHCTSGNCCATGLTWCNGCTNTQNDNANCGSCGHSCAALYGCSSGSCVFLGL